MSQLNGLEAFCTDSIMQGEKIRQVPFCSRGSFVCSACAAYCRRECQGQVCEEKKVYFFEYQCQCQFMPGGCQLMAEQETVADLLPDMKEQERKQMFKEWMKKVLLGLSTREIAPNILA